MILRPVLAALLLAGPAGLVGPGGLAACAGTGGDDDRARASWSPESAETRLDRQRHDVRAAARTLLRDAERRLGGRTALSTGTWRGCESAGIEEYRNFRYLGQARVEVAAGSVDPALAALRAVLHDAGFAAGEVRSGPGGGRTRLAGRHGDLTAVFSRAGGSLVGLDVYGPCIDVPEQDRDAWLRRPEPTPDLLRH